MRTIHTFVIVSLFTFFAALAIGGSWSCATAIKDVETGGSAFLTCEKQNIQQDLPSVGKTVLEEVTDILEGGSGDVVAQLDALGGDVALQTIECAVLAVETVLHPSTGSAAPEMSAVVGRAESYLAAHKVKLAPPKK